MEFLGYDEVSAGLTDLSAFSCQILAQSKECRREGDLWTLSTRMDRMVGASGLSTDRLGEQPRGAPALHVQWVRVG